MALNIQILIEEIKNKLDHGVSTKLNSYLKTIENEPDFSKESKASFFITDLTFQITSKIIKNKISKINPKPVEFSLQLNSEKYFEQTIQELKAQVQEGVFFDDDEVASQKLKFIGKDPFEISFKGYFLEDYCYIGTKKIKQIKELKEEWFPSILACLRVKEEDTEEAKDILSFLHDFVSFGFNKALDSEFVFVDDAKMKDSLKSIDFATVKGIKMNEIEFLNFREENLLNRKNNNI